MAKISISPFKTLSEDCPVIQVNESLESGYKLERNEFVKGYTCENDINIKIHANILASAVFDLLGLPNESLIIFIARARSPNTMFMCSAQSQPFNSNFSGDIIVNLLVPKGMVANTLHIDYSLVLLSPTKTKILNTAKDVGDILWESSAKFLLEGTGSMFPISTVDFSIYEGGKQGAWRLDWSRTSLHGSPSKVRLLLNGLNKDFINQINPENSGEPNQYLINMLYYSVACSILEYAVKNEEEIRKSEFELGTLGDFIIRFLNSHFKINGQPTGKDNVISRYIDDPEGVRALLQSNLKINN
ncbi:MAG: hypothetical protein EBQ49_00515 [Verrucomicrobia bacterium]|nr:hypothetical protein [Verrucomicrobiota bacterium]